MPLGLSRINTPHPVMNQRLWQVRKPICPKNYTRSVTRRSIWYHLAINARLWDLAIMRTATPVECERVRDSPFARASLWPDTYRM